MAYTVLLPATTGYQVRWPNFMVLTHKISILHNDVGLHLQQSHARPEHADMPVGCHAQAKEALRHPFFEDVDREAIDLPARNSTGSVRRAMTVRQKTVPSLSS